MGKKINMLIVLCAHAREVQGVYLALGYMHTHGYPEAPKTFCLMHTWRLHQQASRSLLAVHGKVYVSTTASPQAAQALPQPCHAP
jgi:hypothetical protein